jgi:hypothetical protein
MIQAHRALSHALAGRFYIADVRVKKHKHPGGVWTFIRSNTTTACGTIRTLFSFMCVLLKRMEN